MAMYTNEKVNEYADQRQLNPGAILWSSEKSLEEDAFRSGAKNHASVNFLRWQDIGQELVKGPGRIPEEEWDGYVVSPGKGISMFIKKMLPERMVHVEPGPATNSRKKKLKEDFDPLVERYWWKIEYGQPIPARSEEHTSELQSH